MALDESVAPTTSLPLDATGFNVVDFLSNDVLCAKKEKG